MNKFSLYDTAFESCSDEDSDLIKGMILDLLYSEDRDVLIFIMNIFEKNYIMNSPILLTAAVEAFTAYRLSGQHIWNATYSELNEILINLLRDNIPAQYASSVYSIIHFLGFFRETRGPCNSYSVSHNSSK